MSEERGYNPNTALSNRIGFLSEEDTIDLAAAISDAVISSVGPHGFHGGLRPGNISYLGSGAVALGPEADPDVSKLEPEELEYISPEIFWGGKRTSASDVYSLGLILYAARNRGLLPFLPEHTEPKPDDRAMAVQRRMKGEEISPPEDASPLLGAVIARGLRFKPDERWQSVSEFKQAITDSVTRTDSPQQSQKAAQEDIYSGVFHKSEDALSDVDKLMAEIIARTSAVREAEFKQDISYDESVSRNKNTGAPAEPKVPADTEDMASAVPGGEVHVGGGESAYYSEVDANIYTSKGEGHTETAYEKTGEWFIPQKDWETSVRRDAQLREGEKGIPGTQRRLAAGMEYEMSGDLPKSPGKKPRTSRQRSSYDDKRRIRPGDIDSALNLLNREQPKPAQRYAKIIDNKKNDKGRRLSPQAETKRSRDRAVAVTLVLFIAVSLGGFFLHAGGIIKIPFLPSSLTISGKPGASPSASPSLSPSPSPSPSVSPSVSPSGSVSPSVSPSDDAQPSPSAEVTPNAVISIPTGSRNPSAGGTNGGTGQNGGAGSTSNVGAGTGNTGNGNTGGGSTGNGNTGGGSTGNGNTGNGSTGNGNTGGGSTGNGSTGNGSTGNGGTGNNPGSGTRPSSNPAPTKAPATSNPRPPQTARPTTRPSNNPAPPKTGAPTGPVIPPVTPPTAPVTPTQPVTPPNPLPPSNDVWNIPGTDSSLIRATVPFDSAKQRASDLGGNIMTINSQEDFDRLTPMFDEMGVNYVWMGATRNASGDWVMSNGEKLQFDMWDDGEPSGTDWDGTPENYLMLRKIDGKGWRFNDVRADPAGILPDEYNGSIAYIIEF